MLGLGLAFSLGNPLLRVGGAAAYSQNRVAFDGTTFRDLNAAYSQADVSTGLVISVWIDLVGTSAATRYDIMGRVNTTGGGVTMRRQVTNKLNLAITGSFAGAPLAETMTTISNLTLTGGLGGTGVYHILASWRPTANAGAGSKQLYLNNVSDYTDAGFLFSADALQIAGDVTKNQLGANGAGGNIFLGQMGDFYMAVGDFDLTDSAVRAKFISAANAPVSLGASGQIPTGAQPGVFFGGDMTASTGGPSGTGWNGGVHHGSWGAFDD